MAKKSDETRARLLVAATDEFAARGIAGARVDRIAAEASANKNLLYVYFGNKEQLFDTVYAASIIELLDAVPFEASDLPGYAGALIDYYRARPQLIRLARWHRLERPNAARLPIAEEANETKVRAIARAQADGVISAGIAPGDLLTLVQTLAGAWSDGAPEVAEGDINAAVAVTRRHAIVVAVGNLVRPPALVGPSSSTTGTSAGVQYERTS